MDENKQNTEEQGKEAKKVSAKFDAGLRKLTAIMGSPDWAKTSRFNKDELPAIIQRITAKKKEEQFVLFENTYVALVEEKKKLDKTIKQKTEEFEKAILSAKKEFNVKVDGLLGMIDRIDQIEKEYYDALSGSGSDETASEATAETTPPPSNQ